MVVADHQMLELKRDMEFMKDQMIRLKKLLHETLHESMLEDDNGC